MNAESEIVESHVARLSDHPVAGIFPLMGERELKHLAESIAERGLKVPIILFEKKILDGRNRYRACLLANVEPEFVEYSGDSPVADVWVWNAARRDLNPTQRAASAVIALPKFVQEALKRQGTRTDITQKFEESDWGESAKHAAELTGANRQYVFDLKAIKDAYPDFFWQCHAGAMMLADAKREIQRIEHAQKIEEAKNAPKTANWETHEIILADPPWRYDFSETHAREIENQYPSASLEDISSHAPNSAAADSILFLWATAPKLLEALKTMADWGFTYRTHAMWDKQKIGMGYWFRGQHELLLVGTKGKPGEVPEPARHASIFSEPRGTHSAKPECVYDWIQEAFPLASKLEMYCRNPRPGWDSWGNEV